MSFSVFVKELAWATYDIHIMSQCLEMLKLVTNKVWKNKINIYDVEYVHKKFRTMLEMFLYDKYSQELLSYRVFVCELHIYIIICIHHLPNVKHLCPLPTFRCNLHIVFFILG